LALTRRFFVIIREGVGIFSSYGCFDRAASISFYAFFSLIPILLLTTVMVGYVLGAHEGLLDRIIEMARLGLPYLGPRIISDLKGLADTWKTFGWVGLALLIFSAELVLDATSEALQHVFELPGKYGFFKKKVVNAVILLIPMFAALVSIIMTAAARILADFDLILFGVNVSYYFQGVLLAYVLPAVLMVMAVSFVYWIVGSPNIDFPYALIGAVVFTVIWELAKQLFAWYISYVPTYNRFYVSIGTMMILLLYIYFSATIFLFSASIARAAYRGAHGSVPHGRRAGVKS